jgi:hypothetical protein
VAHVSSSGELLRWHCSLIGDTGSGFSPAPGLFLVLLKRMFSCQLSFSDLPALRGSGFSISFPFVGAMLQTMMHLHTAEVVRAICECSASDARNLFVAAAGTCAAVVAADWPPASIPPVLAETRAGSVFAVPCATRGDHHCSISEQWFIACVCVNRRPALIPPVLVEARAWASSLLRLVPPEGDQHCSVLEQWFIPPKPPTGNRSTSGLLTGLQDRVRLQMQEGVLGAAGDVLPNRARASSLQSFRDGGAHPQAPMTQTAGMPFGQSPGHPVVERLQHANHA